MSAELPNMPEPNRVSQSQFQEAIPLYTADQMRAYAQEAARQAMERTLSICRQMEERGYDAKDCAEAIEDAIRTLLPPTSPTSEENGNG